MIKEAMIQRKELIKQVFTGYLLYILSGCVYNKFNVLCAGFEL